MTDPRYDSDLWDDFIPDPDSNRDPKLQQYIWNEENLEHYRRSLQKAPDGPGEPWAGMTHQLFYIDPVGTLAQNQTTIALTIQYLSCHGLPEDLSDKLFDYDFPLLRVDCMSETEPRSGQFRPVSFDLLKAIVAQKDIPLLKKLRRATDFSDYPAYAEQIEKLLREEA